MLRTAWLRSLLVIFVLLTAGYTCAAQVAITVSFAPPELPVYEQPICPGEDYIWNPGYWGWDADDEDYYWVPGTWVLAPQVGYLWTPPYWGWADGGFRFYAGYWGPVVGFYGGIVYGFGYYGHGYEGGRWEHDHFFYNRYVNNVNVTVIHNVYETRIDNHYDREVRVAYNGHGGIDARPTAEEEAAARQRHIEATPAQMQHFQAARQNRQLHASENRGRPSIAATPRPAEFNGREVVAAKAGGNYTPPPNRGNANRGSAGGGAPNNNRPSSNYVHAKELPPIERGVAPHTGNAQVDQKHQQQQQKLYDKQNQERQKLQQKQDQEHQKFEQQQARQQQQATQRQEQQQQMQQRQQQAQQRQQQMEQRHQQQTQQMQQRHTDQQQRLQQRQAPPPQQSHGNPPQHH